MVAMCVDPRGEAVEIAMEDIGKKLGEIALVDDPLEELREECLRMVDYCRLMVALEEFEAMCRTEGAQEEDLDALRDVRLCMYVKENLVNGIPEDISVTLFNEVEARKRRQGTGPYEAPRS